MKFKVYVFCLSIDHTGENKNRFTLGYLAWRTITGRHQRVTFHTQVPYHGRCRVDGGFGNIKRLYRR